MERIRSKQEFTYRGAFPSLAKIASEAKVPPSTFTRLQAGKGIDGAALLRILLWLKLNGEKWDRLMSGLVKNGRKRAA